MIKIILQKYFNFLPYSYLRLTRIQIILLFLILFVKPINIIAQTDNIKFNRIGVDEGLSQGTIYEICQDSLGFLWFATENGLNRFNGYTFKVYNHNISDEYTISSNMVSSLLTDRDNNLWIGTNQGLNYYDPNNDRMIQKPHWPKTSITSIAEDDNNNLWIGSYGYLYQLDLKKDTLITYLPKDAENPDGVLSNDIINTVCVDQNQNVWIGTNNGLNVYDNEKNVFISYFHDSNDPTSLSNNRVRSLLVDKDGRLWIGTASGLDLFTNHAEIPSKGEFTRFQHNSSDPNSISDGRILALMEDESHNLWISTENSGLCKLNLSLINQGSAQFIQYKNNTNDNTSLSFNSVGSIFQDRQKNIWIGTMGDGINLINAFEKQFYHIKNQPGNPNSLSNNMVNTFLEDGDYMWIGTEGGINRYHKKDGSFKHFIHDANDPSSIGANAVWAICKSNRGNLWVGTWSGGLNQFNPDTETFTHFYHDPNDNKSLSNNNIFDITEDSNKNIWIGTIGGGICMFNRNDNTFTTYNQDNSTLGNYIYEILEATDGNFWIVTSDDLVRFDLAKKTFEHFIHDVTDTTTISSKQIFDVFQDSKGNIWAGTDQGLNVLNKGEKSFKLYDTDNGLPDNGVRSILEDDHGNLWLGTYKGLSKFLNAVEVPEQPEFKNYTIEDGIQSNEFRGRSAYRGSDGMMYFGGVNGFNMFYPDSIKNNPYVPDVVFTDFLLFNRPVQIGEKDSQLNKNISLTQEIELSHKQSFFTIKFVAMNYNAPEKNEYSTIMEGLEEDWNYLGNKREVTYRNLKPGEYIFRVKASNNDGVWNEQGASLKITILPRWWLTWYFKVFYVILAILFLLLIYRIRTSALRKQKVILEETVKERTRDLNEKNKLLETQSDELVKINAIQLKHQKTIEAQAEELKVTAEDLEKTNAELINLNATKDKFFNIIAHDLRGPFNSFLGLTELMAEELPNLSMDKIQTISISMRNSAKNLFRLIENLLHWARIQQGRFPINKEMLELLPVVDESVALINETAIQKNITISSDVPKGLEVYADKNVIQMVVRNLLSNALKFTHEGGRIGIMANRDGNFVNVSVKDSGIGMSENLIENLFRLDAQTNRKGTNGEPSTGLGLIICKELVEKQGGKLWVESEEGVGTVFHFSLEADK